MKKAAELVVVDNFKATTKEDKLNAVKQVVIGLVVKEWQKKSL